MLSAILSLSASFHDAVFAVGSLILFLALVPAVFKRAIIPLSTCWITGGVLFVFTLNYLSMSYWYAVVVETANVACWAYLFSLTWKARNVF